MGPTISKSIPIISYLISKTEEGKVQGYSNLAERLLVLRDDLEKDNEFERFSSEELRLLIEKRDDNSLDWDNLQEFIEDSRDDRIGSLFISVGAEEKDPNEYVYEFKSKPPEGIIETHIEGQWTSEEVEKLKNKIRRAAALDQNSILKEVYGIDEF